MSGLNNPRQLSLTHDGILLVAEAGKGGDTCGGMSPEGDETCVGNSGSISMLGNPFGQHDTTPNRIIKGLPSGAGKDGSFATGSDGVSAKYFRHGTVYTVETWGAPETIPAGYDASGLGKLWASNNAGDLHVVADIAGYEVAHDPDGKGIDSNPYAVLDTGRVRYVADAAANTVYTVDDHGTVKPFHIFENVTTHDCLVPAAPSPEGPPFEGFDPTPNFPGCNFVPTSLAAGPNGSIYVGGLSSLQPNQAQVIKLNHDGHIEQLWEGFTSITGIDVADDGTFYVSQLMAPQVHPVDPMVTGVVTQVKNGIRTNQDVPFPAGIVENGTGNVLVSAFSVAPESGLGGAPGTSGQIWKLHF
jgi:hypothetical protein